MSKLETNTIDTVSGTSTLQVGSTNTSTITLGVSGDTVNVPSGVTIANSGTATGFGGTNTPNFLIFRSGNQSISNTTNTKVQFDSETYDTANAYDNSSNYRFTPQTAGKYHLYSNVYLANGSSATMQEYTITMFKNGSGIVRTHLDHRTSGVGYQQCLPIAVVAEANGSSDYFEVFIYGNWGGGSLNVTSDTFFGGYKIIE